MVLLVVVEGEWVVVVVEVVVAAGGEGEGFKPINCYVTVIAHEGRGRDYLMLREGIGQGCGAMPWMCTHLRIKKLKLQTQNNSVVNTIWEKVGLEGRMETGRKGKNICICFMLWNQPDKKTVLMAFTALGMVQDFSAGIGFSGCASYHGFSRDRTKPDRQTTDEDDCITVTCVAALQGFSNST